MSAFLNRIKKNVVRIRAWANRDRCSAYRIYDRDIPEFAVSVDFYDGYLVVYRYYNAEFAVRDEHNFVEIMAGLRQFFQIDESKIFVKERTRQKGNLQYSRVAHASVLHTVREFDLNFIVNLSDFLDTGLFLDHRLSRSWVRNNCRDLSVLNLFCYTGSVSVHAAAGGAKRVVSVDLSARYLDWAQENFLANGFKKERYEFVRADVCQWLKECQERFDLIFLDPPSFSNSKKMLSDFDVQRDHFDMIIECLRLLSPQGQLFFSNNLRSFKLDQRLSTISKITDISKSTIPSDFQNQLIHKAWLLSHLTDC